MKIYIAHQITGLTFDEVVDYYDWAKDYFGGLGYEVLCPMTAKGYLRTEYEHKAFVPKGYTNPISTNHAIFERDKWMVQNCDVLYCDFTGSGKILTGCIFELAWATILGKHTVTVVPSGNIHQHAFVLEASDICFECTADALNYFTYLLYGRIE
jgi:hypothetical protein